MSSSEARRQRRLQPKRTTICLDELDATCDVQVEAKEERFVMIFANAKGRRIIEDLWPDVEWTTDDLFKKAGHSADWLYTHIRVTQLPAHLEEEVPLSRAKPDSIGFAVAWAIAGRSDDSVRVVHWSGYGADLKINRFGVKDRTGVDSYCSSLLAEYVPPHVWVRGDDKPGSVH